MFNTHNPLRWTLYDSMEDQVVMTHAKQSNDKSRHEEVLCLAEQRPTYFLPSRFAYLSHIHFHLTSTRAPPVSRDLWSPHARRRGTAEADAPINVHRSPPKCSDAPKGNRQCGRRPHTSV